MKKFAVIVSAAAISVASMGAFAGLTLCSNGYPNQIDVSCHTPGGKSYPGFPIPASTKGSPKCASFIGQKDMPFILIKYHFGGNDLVCNFYDHKLDPNHSKAIGTANLTIASDEKTATIKLDYLAPNDSAPITGNGTAEVGVTVSQNK